MANLPSKLDKIAFRTQFGTYQISQTWRIPLDISGSIPNNYFAYYGAGFTLTNELALARVYIENSAGLRAPFVAGGRLATYSPNYEIYDFASSEIVETDINYSDGGYDVDVLVYIINGTGGTLNLVTQTLYLVCEFYQAPVE